MGRCRDENVWWVWELSHDLLIHECICHIHKYIYIIYNIYTYIYIYINSIHGKSI